MVVCVRLRQSVVALVAQTARSFPFLHNCVCVGCVLSVIRERYTLACTCFWELSPSALGISQHRAVVEAVVGCCMGDQSRNLKRLVIATLRLHRGSSEQSVHQCAAIPSCAAVYTSAVVHLVAKVGP